MQADLRRRLGDAQLLCELLVREVVEGAQDHDRPELGWEPPQGLLELGTQLDVGHPVLRIPPAVEVGDVGLVGELLVPVLGAPAEVGRRAVRRDPVEPRRELGVTAETLEALVGPQVRVLSHVVCVLLVTGEPIGEGVRVGEGLAHERVERRSITLSGPGDQIGQVVGHRRVGPRGHWRSYVHDRKATAASRHDARRTDVGIAATGPGVGRRATRTEINTVAAVGLEPTTPRL